MGVQKRTVLKLLIFRLYSELRSEFYFYFVKVLLKPIGFSYIIFAIKLPEGQYHLGVA